MLACMQASHAPTNALVHAPSTCADLILELTAPLVRTGIPEIVRV